MKLLNLIKPSWYAIEVVHERYNFDTYITYYGHTSLRDVEKDLMITGDLVEIDRTGCRIYDLSGQREEGTYYTEDEYGKVKIKSYGINYTILIPAHQIKKYHWFMTGYTKNKFGLFDREYLKDSIDE